MEQLAFKILISIIILTLACYILFCMFLTVVAMPKDNSNQYKFQFVETPKGLVKISRTIGFVIAIGFCIMIPIGIIYTVLFD